MSSPWGRVATPGRRSNGASSAAGRAPECRVRRRRPPRRALARLRSNALPCRFVSGAPLRAAVLVILFFPACISASPLARAASKTAGDWRQVRPIEAPPCRSNHCGLQYAHRAAGREARRHGHKYGCGHMCTCSQKRAHTHAAPHTAVLATDGTGAGWVPSAVSRCRSGSQKVGRVAEAQGQSHFCVTRPRVMRPIGVSRSFSADGRCTCALIRARARAAGSGSVHVQRCVPQVKSAGRGGASPAAAGGVQAPWQVHRRALRRARTPDPERLTCGDGWVLTGRVIRG